MNKYTLLPAILYLFANTLNAQAPPALFQYQAVVRDGLGVLANDTIALQVSILKNNMNGMLVYREEHNNVQTNEFGLIALQIGGGIVISGTNLADIDWGDNTYWLQVSFQPPGQTDFLMLNAVQLLSVPYALFSGKAANAIGGDPDSTNELQTLSLSGNNLSISNGNSVSLAGIGSQWLNNPTGVHYSAGRVGIRTAAPQGQLEIINDEELTTGLVVTKTIGNEPIALFRAASGNSGSATSIGRDGILNINRFFSPATNSTFLRFYRANSPKARMGLNSQDELALLTGDTETPALVVDATGRIGIGTDDPTAGLSVIRGDDAPALAVTKTGGTQPIAVFNRDQNPGSEAMIITRPGSVGIGVSNPDERLHLHNGIFRISQSDFGPQTGVYMRFYKGGTEYSRIGLNQNNGLAFFKGATDEPVLNVNSNGNVGIGSDNPDATLQVNGTVSVFGNWDARSPGAVYQAPTDGFVVVRLTVTGNNKIRAEGFTSPDDSFTESEIRAGATAWSNSDVNSFTMPVAKGEYWKVEITAQDPAGTNIWVRWRPLGL